MQKSKTSTRKRVAGAVSILLIIAILLGGTFAWNNYRQHKTNDSVLGGMYYKAVLVEEYDRTKAQDWKITDPELTKKISVLNPGAETDADDHVYGDIYARLSLKEFMEFYPVSQVLTDVRYMIDENGAFIGFDDKNEAEAYAAAVDAKYGNGPHTVEQLRMFFTPIKTNSVAANQTVALAHSDWIDSIDPTKFDETKVIIDPVEGRDDADLPWYIQTKENDPNGVYGNFMTIDAQIDYANNRNLLVEDTGNPGFNLLGLPMTERANEDQKTAPDGCHNELIGSAVDVGYSLSQINGECKYTPHQWINGQYQWLVNGTGEASFFDYIGWVFGKDVVLASKWNGEPVDKWIIDDESTNTEGWVYWGNPIAPGQQTSNFLEAISLLQQSSDRAYYALHVDMQAVSYDELYRWTEAEDNSGSDPIVAALRKSGMKVLALQINEHPETVNKTETQTFTASVVGSTGVNQDVTWSISDYSGGSNISQSGVLTVGAGEFNGTLTIRATSKHDPSKYDEWTVNVAERTVVSGLTISPTTANAPILQATTFTATETFSMGASQSTGVTWSLEAGTLTDLSNISFTINPTDPMKVIVVVNRNEAANIGETFKVVVTANDPDAGGLFKTASATVTIQAEPIPVVASTRYIPAAKAGDTSDWIEIAKTIDGKYSLMVRKTSIGNSVFGTNTNYSTSTLRNNINIWFNNPSNLTTLRNYTVQNTAFNDLGSHPNINSGISVPRNGYASTGNDIAFAPSFSELVAFCSETYNSNGSAVANSPSGASLNFSALGLTPNPTNRTMICWTRSTSLTTDSPAELMWWNSKGSVSYEAFPSINDYSQSAPIISAVWIDADAAENAPGGNLFSTRP